MTTTEAICKNCEHQGQFQGTPHLTFLRECFVWNQIKNEDMTCQHFQLSTRLIPKRKTVREREGKMNMGEV